jgi:hypothetical protein
MSWWDVPFGYRSLAAAAFLGLVSGIELLIRGRSATRWRGSLFLVGSGILGGLFGMSVDWVTSSISSTYFSVGKGLGEGQDLTTRILLLGLEAGTYAGVVVGCFYLVASHQTRILVRQLYAPILGALACALVFGVVVASLVDLDPVGRFKVVSATHIGLYVGGLAGAVAGFRRIRECSSSHPSRTPPLSGV